MSLLNFLVFPYLLGALLFAFKKNTKLAQILNILGNGVWLFLLFPVIKFSNEHAGEFFAIEQKFLWFNGLKSHFALGVDGLSISLIVLNVLLSLCLAFYALGKEKLGGTYLSIFSILNGASVGALMAADALLFYVFWEFMLIPLFFLILRWGSKSRVYAALKFFAFTMAGSLLMLLAIVALVEKFGAESLLWHDLAKVQLSFDGFWSPQSLMFWAFAIAFAVKVPVWPLHTWLPDAHTEAPTGGSVILAGVLLKLGVYGFMRWCIPLFPQAAQAYAQIFMVVGVIGIVLGSFAAWIQSDVKRMIAYSSVAHLGFMVLGVFAFKEQSFQGAMFQNIAHGLSTGALFLIFGIIYERTHTRELSQYGGLASKNAFLAISLVTAAMASVGLPCLPGFIGEFLVLSGTYLGNSTLAIAALSGVLLGGIYTLHMLRKMVWGAEGPALSHLGPKIEWSEYVAVVPLLIALLICGLRPQFILDAQSEALKTILGMALR